MTRHSTFAATTLEREEVFKPRRPGGMSRGALLALLAHAALIAGLAVGLRWRTHAPDVISAEVWSATPQQAAPAPAPAPPPPPPAPVVTPKVEPAPPPPRVEPDAREAQIAIEQEKRKAEAEQRQREREKRIEDARRERERAEQQRKEAEEQRKREAEAQRKAKAEEERLAKQRDDQLRRLRDQVAGATGGATATGNAQRDAAPSTEYAGRIKARIKPNIVFAEDVTGNPTASVIVTVDPTGRIVGRRLTKSSGSRAWDDAVLRAIDRTEVLPRDVDGRVPPSIAIDFRPNE